MCNVTFSFKQKVENNSKCHPPDDNTHHHTHTHRHTHLTGGAPGQQQGLGWRRGALPGPPVALAEELAGRWRGPGEGQGGRLELILLQDELLDEVCWWCVQVTVSTKGTDTLTQLPHTNF